MDFTIPASCHHLLLHDFGLSREIVSQRYRIYVPQHLARTSNQQESSSLVFALVSSSNLYKFIQEINNPQHNILIILDTVSVHIMNEFLGTQTKVMQELKSCILLCKKDEGKANVAHNENVKMKSSKKNLVCFYISHLNCKLKACEKTSALLVFIDFPCLHCLPTLNHY